jgi:hypothetical protein
MYIKNLKTCKMIFGATAQSVINLLRYGVGTQSI